VDAERCLLLLIRSGRAARLCKRVVGAAAGRVAGPVLRHRAAGRRPGRSDGRSWTEAATLATPTLPSLATPPGHRQPRIIAAVHTRGTTIAGFGRGPSPSRYSPKPRVGACTLGASARADAEVQTNSAALLDPRNTGHVSGPLGRRSVFCSELGGIGSGSGRPVAPGARKRTHLGSPPARSMTGCDRPPHGAQVPSRRSATRSADTQRISPAVRPDPPAVRDARVRTRAFRS
jgi:hypothetical protein